MGSGAASSRPPCFSFFFSLLRLRLDTALLPVLFLSWPLCLRAEFRESRCLRASVTFFACLRFVAFFRCLGVLVTARFDSSFKINSRFLLLCIFSSCNLFIQTQLFFLFFSMSRCIFSLILLRLCAYMLARFANLMLDGLCRDAVVSLCLHFGRSVSRSLYLAFIFKYLRLDNSYAR